MSAGGTPQKGEIKCSDTPSAEDPGTGNGAQGMHLVTKSALGFGLVPTEPTVLFAYLVSQWKR